MRGKPCRTRGVDKKRAYFHARDSDSPKKPLQKSARFRWIRYSTSCTGSSRPPFGYYRGTAARPLRVGRHTAPSFRMTGDHFDIVVISKLARRSSCQSLSPCANRARRCRGQPCLWRRPLPIDLERRQRRRGRQYVDVNCRGMVQSLRVRDAHASGMRTRQADVLQRDKTFKKKPSHLPSVSAGVERTTIGWLPS